MRKEQVLVPVIRQIVSRPKIANALLGRDRWGNPFSDDVLADPMILAGPMREDGPVHWHPMYQQWFIMGYDEAREALGSPHVGTKTQMDVMLSITPYTKMKDRTRTLLGNLMLLTDPPQHTRLRGLVSRAFTPRQISRLEPRMEILADKLLADLGDDVELMRDFAVKFPAMVIAELIGFEPEEWEWLYQVSAALTQITDPIRGFDHHEIDAASDELHQRIIAMAAERRKNPTEDLLSALAQVGAEDGDRLSEAELISMISLLLIAGNETTSGMIALSVLQLRDHPDQMAMLEQRPELWPNAVEEILRFDPTLRNDPRTALEDFELAGHKIKKGQNIVIMTQLANRDFRRLPDADDLRVDREDPAPLSFGHGIHYCLGASLARTELRIALPRLFAALADYEFDSNEVEWRPSISLRSPSVFPLHRTG